MEKIGLNLLFITESNHFNWWAELWALDLLAETGHYKPKFLLRTLHYALFNSHLIYACQIWRLKETMIRELLQLQNKAMRITNFKPNAGPNHES